MQIFCKEVQSDSDRLPRCSCKKRIKSEGSTQLAFKFSVPTILRMDKVLGLTALDAPSFEIDSLIWSSPCGVVM